MTLRRNLLTAAAASMMLPCAAIGSNVQLPDIHPDVDLIAACDRFLAIQREFEAYYETLPGDMEDDDPAWAMLDPMPELEERIVSLQAVTAEGHFARARCAAFFYLSHHPSCQDNPDAPREMRFRAAALRDLVHAERGGRA